MWSRKLDVEPVHAKPIVITRPETSEIYIIQFTLKTNPRSVPTRTIKIRIDNYPQHQRLTNDDLTIQVVDQLVYPLDSQHEIVFTDQNMIITKNDQKLDSLNYSEVISALLIDPYYEYAPLSVETIKWQFIWMMIDDLFYFSANMRTMHLFYTFPNVRIRDRQTLRVPEVSAQPVLRWFVNGSSKLHFMVTPMLTDDGVQYSAMNETFYADSFVLDPDNDNDNSHQIINIYRELEDDYLGPPANKHLLMLGRFKDNLFGLEIGRPEVAENNLPTVATNSSLDNDPVFVHSIIKYDLQGRKLASVPVHEDFELNSTSNFLDWTFHPDSFMYQNRQLVRFTNLREYIINSDNYIAVMNPTEALDQRSTRASILIIEKQTLRHSILDIDKINRHDDFSAFQPIRNLKIDNQGNLFIDFRRLFWLIDPILDDQLFDPRVLALVDDPEIKDATVALILSLRKKGFDLPSEVLDMIVRQIMIPNIE